MTYNLTNLRLTVANHCGRPVSSIKVNGSAVYAGSDHVGTIDERRNRLRLDGADYFLDGLNPVVKETPLSRYPGWTVREYADGKFDCSGRIGLSPGYDTFAEAVGFAKRDGASA
jgi:hypothetical protein